MTGSAVYEGWVVHRRFGAVPHSFRYRVFMPLFDLDELPGVLDSIPLWSARRPAPARFCEADHLPGGEGPLAVRARDLVQARLGRRPGGPVRLLANPRYLGVGFNPVSFLFLHGDESRLDSVIAEVTNTPWRERTEYVLDAQRAASERHVMGTFRKGMHVSPFQPMEQTYEISVTRAGREIRRCDPEPGTGPPGLRREHGPAPPRDHARPHAAAPARLSADDDRDPGPDLRERPAAETSRSAIPSPSGGESR